jgi:hypothetical protein
MNVEQIENQLMELPMQERRRFARWFYEQEEKLLGDSSETEISPEIQEEIFRRRDALRANPGLAVPVTDEWFQRLKQKLSLARASKASAS